MVDGTGDDIFIAMFIGEEADTRVDPSIGVEVSGNVLTGAGAGIGAGGRILFIGKFGNDDKTCPETGSGTETDMGAGAAGIILSIGNCGTDDIT